MLVAFTHVLVERLDRVRNHHGREVRWRKDQRKVRSDLGSVLAQNDVLAGGLSADSSGDDGAGVADAGEGLLGNADHLRGQRTPRLLSSDAYVHRGERGRGAGKAEETR
jgi:hypothetical protein